MEKNLRFRKGDLLAAALVLLAAVLVFLCFLPRNGEAACAEIYQDGHLIRTLSLDQDTEFTVTAAYTNTITVSEGRIAVTHSDCPGEDCVGCGWISSSGRSLVCLPNGLEIRIVSDQSDVDFVVG